MPKLTTFTETFMEVLQELRIVTHDVHERLHHHPLLLNLINEKLTRDDYVWVLRSFERFYEGLNARIGLELIQEKLSLIKHDTDFLGCNENPLPRCKYFKSHFNSNHSLGVKYVIIGSALGGSLISKNIEKQLKLKPGMGIHILDQARIQQGNTGKTISSCSIKNVRINNSAMRQRSILLRCWKSGCGMLTHLRKREAEMTLNHSDEDKKLYEDAQKKCAEEKIHIPGSIQPYAYLIIFDEQQNILKLSENAAEAAACKGGDITSKT